MTDEERKAWDELVALTKRDNTDEGDRNFICATRVDEHGDWTIIYNDAILAADARIRELEEVLSDAVDLAEEGWGYASDYFRDKWNYIDRLAELRKRAGMEGK